MTEIIETAKERLKDLKKYSFIDKIRDKLFLLKELTERANQERFLCGMTQICSQCGKEGTSCCAPGVEFKYSTELIIINLYFGINIPYENEFDNMCFFLTKEGCCLFVRDVFCINFICEKIKKAIPLEKIKRLRYIEGLQLELQFELESFLRKIKINKNQVV